MCMVVLPTFMCLDCVPSPLCNQEEVSGGNWGLRRIAEHWGGLQLRLGTKRTVGTKGRDLGPISRGVAELWVWSFHRGRREDFSVDGNVQEQSLMALREGGQAADPSSPPRWNPATYNGRGDSAEGISGNLLLHGPGALRSSGWHLAGEAGAPRGQLDTSEHFGEVTPLLQRPAPILEMSFPAGWRRKFWHPGCTAVMREISPHTLTQGRVRIMYSQGNGIDAPGSGMGLPRKSKASTVAGFWLSKKLRGLQTKWSQEPNRVTVTGGAPGLGQAFFPSTISFWAI